MAKVFNEERKKKKPIHQPVISCLAFSLHSPFTPELIQMLACAWEGHGPLVKPPPKCNLHLSPKSEASGEKHSLSS